MDNSRGNCQQDSKSILIHQVIVQLRFPVFLDHLSLSSTVVFSSIYQLKIFSPISSINTTTGGGLQTIFSTESSSFSFRDFINASDF